MIRKTASGYIIKSKSGNKTLGKFATKKAAVKRLGQIEYFKHKAK